MAYRLLADLVVLIHFTFVGFVVLGGLLVLRWPRLMWLHLPAALWGMLIELVGWVCPLTPLEMWLRARGGESGYEGGFVEHYILPLVYPGSLTRSVQVVLGLAVLIINSVIYVWFMSRQRKKSE